MRTMSRLTTLAVILLLSVGQIGCGKESAKFPPATGNNDELAATLEGATLNLQILKESQLSFSGEQELGPGQFIPIAGSFTVSGGEVVSKIGSVEKRATFGSWSPIKNAAGRVIGYGFDLTSGEVVLPNVFLSVPPSELRVTNSYEAEDLGADYSLITLDPTKKHRLTVQYLIADGQGMFGSLRSSVSRATVSGAILLSPHEKLLSPTELDESTGFLAMTASCIGTRVRSGSEVFERREDGWYVGEVRASP